VCIFPAFWLGETRTRTAFRYEEQQRQGAEKVCNRACSVLANMVDVVKSMKVNVYAAYQEQESGQLRSLG